MGPLTVSRAAPVAPSAALLCSWTGPAQVQKGITEPAGYTEFDLRYVELCRASSGLHLVRYDLGILWRTVKVLARGQGLEF